jgi:hypothetical protein
VITLKPVFLEIPGFQNPLYPHKAGFLNREYADQARPFQFIFQNEIQHRDIEMFFVGKPLPSPTNIIQRIYQGDVEDPDPSRVHLLKSIGLPHLSHLWVLLNSSENISFSSPHSGHLQENEDKFLNDS